MPFVGHFSIQAAVSLHGLCPKVTQVGCVLGHTLLGPHCPSNSYPAFKTGSSAISSLKCCPTILALTDSESDLGCFALGCIASTQSWIITGQFHVHTYCLTRQILSSLIVILYLREPVSPPKPSSAWLAWCGAHTSPLILVQPLFMVGHSPGHLEGDLTSLNGHRIKCCVLSDFFKWGLVPLLF